MGFALAAFFTLAAPAPVIHAQDAGDVKQDMKDAGKASKDAAKDTAKAAKDAAKTTKHSAKAAKKSAKSRRYAARCNDGTAYAGRTKKGACAAHGGVREWTRG